MIMFDETHWWTLDQRKRFMAALVTQRRLQPWVWVIHIDGPTTAL